MGWCGKTEVNGFFLEREHSEECGKPLGSLVGSSGCVCLLPEFSWPAVSVPALLA